MAFALVVSLLQSVVPGVARASTLVATVQAETLTKSGSTSASSTGLTFYSNNDSAYGTVTFPDAGRYTITVNGSSTASNSAGISLLVGGAKVGALTFSGTAYTDATATFDLATGGAKEVRLKLETDNGQNDTRIDYLTVSYVGPTPPLPAAPVPPAQGAFASGQYRDLFQEWNPALTQSDIQQKLDAYWTSFFTGTDDTKRVYYPAGSNASGNLAYILDTGNSDIRSEGMSYGMMIAVQMNKKAEFDAIWNWAKTYMQQTTGPRTGYFCWQATTSGSCSDPNPASDGEAYFATALLFAGNRWGNGTGIYNYAAEGNAILNTMLHKEDMNGGVVDSITNMFNKTNKTVVFVPYASSASFSDPSYNLPAFYELWGRWATGWNGNQAADRQFWLDAAVRSRQYFGQATNATTGLAPDYAEFTGAPNNTGNHGDFRFDAWRTAVNWSVDYAWWAADPNEKVLSDRLQSFFDGQGSASYVNQYSLTGSPLSGDRSPGLIASNGAASLAATSSKAWKFVEALWNLQPPTGQYRYYDGLLNYLALLHASGSFKIYGPGSAAPDTVAPTAPTAVAKTAATSTSVSLSWTASTDNRAVTGYTAYVGANTAGAAGCTAVTSTSCTITGLAPNTSYSITVKAMDAAGNVSTASTALVVTTAAASTSPPNAPSQLAAISSSSTSATLTWNDNSNDETGFVIERKVGTAGTWATVTTTAANTTKYVDTGLTAGTQYSYRVHAVNGAGSSATSNEASTTPSAGGSSANRNAAYKIEAESFDDSNNVTIEAADGGTVVNFASSASWVKFSGVNFGTTNVARVFFRAQKTSSGGNLELYVDNLTTSRCTVYPDGNNTWALKDNSCWPTFQGIHDVYIKPTGPIKLNYFYVTPQSSGGDAPPS